MSDPTMIDLHRTYNTRTGTFTEKRDADAVTSRLRAMMGRRFTDFNPLAIKLEGRKGAYHIEFPRIQMHWHPDELSVRGIAQEVTNAARLFAECYEVKPQGD